MASQEIVTEELRGINYPTTYREVKVGKILYRVTSVFKGEIELKNALEDLAVRRALREFEAGAGQ